MNPRYFASAAWIALLSIALGTFGVLPAHADRKNYAGSTCVRWSGPAPTYYYSALGNPSPTETLYVDCPANTSSLYSGEKSGWVQFLDRHFSSNISCTLVTVFLSQTSPNGWIAWSGPAQTSAGSSDTAQLKAFTLGQPFGNNSAAHTYYSCAIPPTYYGNTSYILSYMVEQ